MRYSASEKYEIIRTVERVQFACEEDAAKVGYSTIHVLRLAESL